MNPDKLIAACVLMRPQAWHALTLQVSWHYRTGGGRPLPPKVLALLAGHEPTLEEWRRIRLTISRRRKYLAKQERYYVARTRAEARRTYMKRYMRERRGTET